MASKKITISGQTFEVNQPYAAGHQITDAEARALNQTRAENIGNNFRKQIKEANGDEGKLQELASELVAYDEKYTFAMGGGGREPVDPVDKEALVIARKAVRGAVESKGYKFKDWLSSNEEKFATLIEEVSQRDNVISQAKAIVKARAKSQSVEIEGL